jgi:hypothetical protein
MNQKELGNRVLEMIHRGVTPLIPYPGSNRPWKCECQVCGSIVTPRYYTVVKSGKGGCNVCAKRNAAQHSKRAAEKRAIEIAKRLNLKPISEYKGAHQIWVLECLICGNVASKKAYSVSNGKGCLKCNQGNGARRKKNEAEPAALEAMRKASLRPLAPYPGRQKPWLAQCTNCGGIVSPRVHGVLSGQGGCVTCGNLKRAKTRSITEEDALRTLLTASAQPLEPFSGSRVPWKALCLKCGLIVKPRIANIKSGASACKRCAMVAADSSFDYFGPAIFYLVKNESLSAMKIGIAGKDTKRLSAHKSNGWEVVKVIDTPYGYQAWYAEGKVLSWLRSDVGLPACVDSATMPQGGFTETFPAGEIDSEIVWKKVIAEISSSAMPIPHALLDGSVQRKARRTCTLVIEGVPCLNPYESNGYCRKHALAFRMYGDPLFSKKVVFANTECEVLESGNPCGKKVDRRGMCSVHYYRNYVYGSPTVLKRATPKALPENCNVPGCDGVPYALEKCQKHYHSARRAKSKNRLM